MIFKTTRETTPARRPNALAMLALAMLLPMTPACFVGGDDEPPASALMRSVAIAAGDQCPYGGVQIDTGLDTNRDGRLGNGEVQQSSAVCNAKVDGYNSLAVTNPVSAGGECPAGGVRVSAGMDLDRDGELDAAEVTSTQLVCNGQRGAAGQDGEDGMTALINVVEVPPGEGSQCVFGGTRIDTGLDVDRDGELDAAEVLHARHVCSVRTNEHLTLVINSAELPGDNCQYGGVKMDVGYDDNGDGALATAEIDSTGYVCNQLVVVDGKNSLTRTTPATAAQCIAGGYVLKTGLDDDRDGQLDDAEVESTSIICSGEDGKSAVFATAPAGMVCGDEGGVVVRAGLDANGNGQLDGGEEQQSFTLCNGADGFLGYDGKDSLIRTRDAGGACMYGGFRMEIGLDDNRDGALQGAEVEVTEFVCNGHDGLDSLVELDPDHDGVCAYDGYRIDTGLDLNEDGLLSFGEVQHTAYVCDGLDGFDSLVNVAPADPFFCPAGGLSFDTGLDLNGDGILQPAEVEQTTQVCD